MYKISGSATIDIPIDSLRRMPPESFAAAVLKASPSNPIAMATRCDSTEICDHATPFCLAWKRKCSSTVSSS